MATFGIGSETLLAGQFSTTNLTGFHDFVGNNSELWIRVYGDSFKINSRQGAAAPFWVSVDGGAWTQPTFTSSPTVTVLSPELLGVSPTDGWHDVRLRLSNGYSGGGTRLPTTTAYVVTSSGGTAQIAKHADYGEYQALRGSFAIANWRHTFQAIRSGTTNFTSPEFWGSQPTGATTSCRNAYVEFYVDGATTKCYIFGENTGTANNRTFSISVNGVRQAPSQIQDTTNGSYGLSGAFTIPGTGVRRVRIINLRALHSIVINGAFVATPIATPPEIWCYSGDSVTAGDSVTTAPDASGNWDQLLDEYFNGQVTILNRGLSGDTATGSPPTGWTTAASGAGRIADFPVATKLIIANMSVNDASRAASVPATVQAEYQDYYNKLLTRCPNARILAIPQLPYQPTNRTAIVSVIQAAVAAINNPRLIYVSSDGWTISSGNNEGAHPKDLGKIEACGGGMAAINLAAQPADGDTITIDGTVFEFDNNSSVTGGRTPVTIGASLVATIDNLAAAIDADGGSFGLMEKIIVTGDTTKQGVGIRDCTTLAKSGTNINVFGPNATGWLPLLRGYLPSTGSGRNVPLLGAG